jgi:hypothetical protein
MGKGFECRNEGALRYGRIVAASLGEQDLPLKGGSKWYLCGKEQKAKAFSVNESSRPKKKPELLIGKMIRIGELNPKHHGIAIILLA